MTDPEVASAELRVALARARLNDTVEDIRQRIKPDMLLRDVWDGVRDKSTALADEAVSTAKARPGAAAGVAAGVALLAMHRPVGRLVRRLFSRRRETEGGDGKL